MRNRYCTLDTETVGGAAHPRGFYNLAGIIYEADGEPLANFNFMIAELYDDIKNNDYAKKNFDRYREMIDNSTITTLASEDMAINAVNELLNFYNVKYLTAFNTGFDFVKTKCSRLLEGREFIDIQLVACQIFATRPSYIKFCRENELFSKSKKSIATSAESFYAFFSKNPNYDEEHLALADSLIEKEIFLNCIKAHKKYTKNCHFANYPNKWSYITKV